MIVFSSSLIQTELAYKQLCEETIYKQTLTDYSAR